MTSPRPAKSQGQWALGEREPLNPNEQFKQDDDALNVRDRILNHYSTAGFDSIEKNDLRGRMRWAGLYTQREQGYDGSFTGDENIDLLEAKYFMMRVRCDGGAISTAALRTLGEISIEFARDTADISDRENVQYHWIRIEDVPADLGAAGHGGAADHRGMRRLPSCGAGLPAGRSVRRRGARPHAGDRGDRPPLHRQPRVLEPAPEIQDRDLGSAGRRA